MRRVRSLSAHAATLSHSRPILSRKGNAFWAKKTHPSRHFTQQDRDTKPAISLHGGGVLEIKKVFVYWSQGNWAGGWKPALRTAEMRSRQEQAMICSRRLCGVNQILQRLSLDWSLRYAFWKFWMLQSSRQLWKEAEF